MLNYDVHYTAIPNDSDCMELPEGKYDVWMRKNIKQEQKKDEQGKKYIDYSADEAYARLDAKPEITPENYDEMYNFVAVWTDGHSDDHGDDKERDATIMQIRADVDYIAMEVGVEL